MILILIILHLPRGFTHPVPTSLLDRDSTAISPTHLPSDHQQPERSILEIVSTCLATIFACSWVSVHPNIPPPGEGWWMAPLRRLELMMWAILAPEIIILWAMRQWIGARTLARDHRAKGWTKSHGHFLQMGGFALFKGRDFQGFLYSAGAGIGGPGDKHTNSLAAEIFPLTTEEEIQDRSKGGSLSKVLAIGQTMWFLIQCIARYIEGLHITELELATAAFSVLNGVMYFLWWDKPLDVRCPIRIQLSDTPGEQPPNVATPERKTVHTTVTLTAIVSGIFYRVAEIGDSREKYAQPGSTFYASTEWDEDNLAMVWASVAALIFGGIHCVGWVLTFPSQAELVIWCICSLVITTLSFVTIAYVFVVRVWEMQGRLAKIVKSLTVVSIPFYIIARVLLLAEAFSTLRDLPPEAYDVVRWATFIPHI